MNQNPPSKFKETPKGGLREREKPKILYRRPRYCMPCGTGRCWNEYSSSRCQSSPSHRLSQRLSESLKVEHIIGRSGGLRSRRSHLRKNGWLFETVQRWKRYGEKMVCMLFFRYRLFIVCLTLCLSFIWSCVCMIMCMYKHQPKPKLV